MNTQLNITEPAMNHSIDMAKDLLAVVVFLTTVLWACLVHSYLNSVSIAKESLLLHLYKEVASTSVWLHCFWLMEAASSTWNWLESREFEAITISLGIWSTLLYLTIVMNIINLLRLHMSKTGFIDIRIPFLGENEKSAINRIRVFSCLTIFGFLGISFGMGVYPNIYYVILRDPDLQPDSVISNLLYRVPISLFLLCFVVTSMRVMFYNKTVEPQIDTVIPRMIYLIVAIIVAAFLSTTIADILNFLNFQTRMKLLQMSLSIIKIILAYAIILRSKELRSHSLRVLKNKYDDLFFLNIYLVPTFLSCIIYGSLCML